MDSKKRFDGLLTNAEVYEILEEYHQRPKRTSYASPFMNRELVETQTLTYLKSLRPFPTEVLHSCLRKIKALSLNLTEAELIQIANHLPTLPVEIHAVMNKMYRICLKFSPKNINIVTILLTYTCL